MGFRSSDRTQTTANPSSGAQTTRRRGATPQESPQQSSAIWTHNIEQGEQHFGMTIPDHKTLQRLQTHESTFGSKVHEWIAEGMPTEIMGKTRDMEAFRQRQAARPPAVPTDIERRNGRSVQRSEQAAAETPPAGETGVPEPVREVIASTGRSLDASIQRAMEDRMGDSLGDVRIHTGPQAAAACESINARAFTVGNHVAFNKGEYDPSSPEGQHVLAHELAHVRQQTGGTVSMLPQEELELEVDPDPALEREAEETAQRVMQGGELGIQRLADTEVHVQRAPKHDALETLAMLELENERGESNISEFREDQNDNRITHLRSAITEFHQGTEDMVEEVEQKGGIEGRLHMKEHDIGGQLADLNDQLEEKIDDVALTDDQRQKLESGIDTGDWADLGTPVASSVVGALLNPLAGMATGVGLVSLKKWFGSLDGDIAERMEELTTRLEEQGDLTGESDSQGVGKSGEVTPE